MPKYGKIAHLPRNIRDELNRRLDNGEPGVDLVKWLNSLPEVKKVLEAEFAGREISEPNLTHWKSYGYLGWQAQQKSLALARELNSNATELAASGGELTNSLARIVAARYAAVLYGWNGEMTDEIRAQLRGLRGLSREVVRLRRSDQTIERMKIQREWLKLGSKASKLNEQRFEYAKRSEESKALDFCLDGTKHAPEARELFKQAFDALEKALESKN